MELRIVDIAMQGGYGQQAGSIGEPSPNSLVSVVLVRRINQMQGTFDARLELAVRRFALL